jgi:TolA-binding protein
VESIDPKTGKITYVGGNQSGKGDGEVTRSTSDINRRDNELLAIRRAQQPKQEQQQEAQSTIDEKEAAIQRNVAIAQEEEQMAQRQRQQETLQPVENNPERALPSGEQIGEAATTMNNTKDSMMMPKAPEPTQQPGLGGGGASSRGKRPRGGSSAPPDSDGTGVAGIMGHGINIRNNESSLLNMQYNLVRTV